MIKTRIAPSPTGFLHIGVLRAALFNYLVAKNKGGKFVIRMEDTDKERSEKRFEKDILETLNWLGIKWDEGPYRQSERGEVYEKYLKKLIDKNLAYYCFCSKEKLEKERENQIKNKIPPRYNGGCFSLKKEESLKKVERGEPFVIRLRMPKEKIEINDLIKGKVVFDASLIGDFVIAKNFKEPLYNFCVAIDDFEMGITHVLRGEDILSSTPKQIVISSYLGIKPPLYGHIPMILGKDKSKLSKRHGATAVSEYLKEGYLKEAIINFLVFLGWSPDSDKDIFSIEELIKEFKVEKINKSNAVFNLEKLDYLNGYYIREKSLDEVTELSVPYFVEKGILTPFFEDKEIVPNLTGIMGKEIKGLFLVNETKEEITFDFLKKVVSLYKERIKKLSEITEFTDYVFKIEPYYEKELLRWKKMELEDVVFSLEETIKVFKEIKEWNIGSLQEKTEFLTKKIGEGDRGRILWPLRVSLTGKKSSAGPFEIADLLGKKKTIERMEKAIEKINF